MTVIHGSGVMTAGEVYMSFDAYNGSVSFEIEREDEPRDYISAYFNPAQWREFLLLVNSLPIPGEAS